MSKSGSSTTTGFRYYFSVLAGICRGPVDEIFQIKSAGYTFFDGSNYAAISGADDVDPDSPWGYTSAVSRTGYTAGTIKDTTVVPISKPLLYGGAKGEGGIDGILWVYMGKKDQVIPASDFIKTRMKGLRLSELRGVVTSFFDGEVAANNPYPKAWTYRVRRVLKGWDGDVWYPERAVIKLTDPAIPTYVRGKADTEYTTTTIIYNDAGVSVAGASTSSGDVTEILSTYDGASISTYASGGVTTTYAVPPLYNDIYAMNPAHIIYECCTNRDWGRGMDRALIDNVSFTDAANRLYDEQFGLCIKWSRTENVDTFVQLVIDHIGAAVYTDRVTGLLCLRLLRADYSLSDLSTFGYDSGLLEIVSAEQAASDATANEVIVKYRSPVLDSDKEARAQNIALINNRGDFFSVTKDYSGIPTSTLALKAAQRELKVSSSGWKRVEFKLDRRAYRLVPGDVLILHAPDRGLVDIVIRVATVDDSVITDGSITVVGTQDVYGWPVTPMVEIEPYNFLEVDRTPKPIQFQNLSEATYRDAVKVAGEALNTQIASDAHKHDGFMTFLAAKPTPSSMNYEAWDESGSYGSSTLSPWSDDGTLLFSRMSRLLRPITSTDTVLQVTGEISPVNTPIGGALLICTDYETYFTEEIVRLDAVTIDAATGFTYLTVARGCVDTPALPHGLDARVWAYEDTGAVIPKFFTGGDLIGFKGITHTMMGDLAFDKAPVMYGMISTVIWTRLSSPYPAANFRVNGYPRDATPVQTGDLVLTWQHRNRIIQADTLVGELEAGVTPETDTNYGLSVQGTTASGTGSYVPFDFDSVRKGITANTYTFTAADLAAQGFISGPMTIFYHTARIAPEYGGLNIPAYRASPSVTFYYDATGSGVPPVTATTGFGFDFGDIFSSGA